VNENLRKGEKQAGKCLSKDIKKHTKPD